MLDRGLINRFQSIFRLWARQSLLPRERCIPTLTAGMRVRGARRLTSRPPACLFVCQCSGLVLSSCLPSAECVSRLAFARRA
eukprot:6200204-Pleurochrysis_carterae.AAC.1